MIPKLFAHLSTQTKHSRLPASLIVRVTLVASFVLLTLVRHPVFTRAAADEFNPTINDSVWAIALQPDGKILLGGNFTEINGTSQVYLARLKPDGSLDESFNSPLTVASGDSVMALAVQPDGKILVGGQISTAARVPQYIIFRLNSDGSIDPSFVAVVDNGVGSLLPIPNGKILVGGAFQNINGVEQSYLARLESDGTLDMGFSPVIDSTIGVYTLALQSDGKILLGGDFTMQGIDEHKNIARLKSDGTLDESFITSTNYAVSTLLIQPDGKILMGGDFTTVNSEPWGFLTRLNTDGSRDTTFTGMAEGLVYSMALQADGKIIVGGHFAALGDGLCRNIGRVNTDGTLDNSFHPDVDGKVVALAVQSDGQVLLGGDLVIEDLETLEQIRRVPNDTSAAQELSLADDGTTIFWMRSGSSPELNWVTFEQSADGMNFIEMGVGTRITGGWELTGLTLPVGEDFYIRAQGMYTSGSLTGSRSIAESVEMFHLNAAPVSHAGTDQTVKTRSLVTLDGSASSDPDDHTPLTYEWTQTSGPSINLSDMTVVSPTFTAPGETTVLTFSLTVTDSEGLSAPTPDEVIITVEPYRIYVPSTRR